MIEALKAKDADWCKKMTVLPGTESRSSPDLPKPDGRTDIPILFQEIREELDEHDPHAIVECKRVAGSDAGLCRLYVVEGIDRFKTGKYAGNHAVGFMAGYLLSDDAEATAGRTHRSPPRISRNAARGALMPRSRPADTRPVADRSARIF